MALFGVNGDCATEVICGVVPDLEPQFFGKEGE